MPPAHPDQPMGNQLAGSSVIRMQAVTKTFKTAAGESTVLKGVDIDVFPGQFVSIVGRSGSGKSTLVNMITGIDRPTAGNVQVGGLDIHTMAESSMAVWRGRNLGIVFQFFQLLPMLTLLENVMLPMDFCNYFPPSQREERALGLLRRVGLENLAHQFPGAVSGGQQQSAAVARALANDPPILIADEPTGNLDSSSAGQVFEIFEELVERGKTILLVTHDRSLARRTHRLLLISDGELVTESLAEAFPDAPHAHLLALGKLAVTVRLSPRGAVEEQGRPVPPLYLVESGEILSGEASGSCCFETGSLVDPLLVSAPLFAGNHGARLLVLPRDPVMSLAGVNLSPVTGRASSGEPAGSSTGESLLQRRPS